MKNQLLKITLIALLSSLAFADSRLERQCNNGDAGSCLNLGNLYYDGDGVKQDYKKAREFYNKACEMGNALGCGALGSLYQYGLGVRQNDSKAMEFFGKACDLGEQKDCDAYKEMKTKLNSNY